MNSAAEPMPTLRDITESIGRVELRWKAETGLGRGRSRFFCAAPPARFELALPPPEGGALSPELRGPGHVDYQARRVAVHVLCSRCVRGGRTVKVRLGRRVACGGR